MVNDKDSFTISHYPFTIRKHEDSPDGTHPNTELPVLDLPDVPEPFALLSSGLDAFPPVGIHVFEILQEDLYRLLHHGRGHQRFDGDVAAFDVQAHLASQDQQLAGDVLALEVVARIGLGVAQGVRLVDDL